jgi:hypothetical protein
MFLFTLALQIFEMWHQQRPPETYQEGNNLQYVLDVNKQFDCTHVLEGHQK